MIPQSQRNVELKAEYDLRYVWLISIVAAMGGLLFGGLGRHSAARNRFFQRYFELTSETQIAGPTVAPSSAV